MAHEDATFLADLIDPEVLADMIDKKLVNNMVFAPLCTVDTTLEGRPGDTITLPSWNYIGDATAVDEGDDIPIKEMSKSTTTATVTKIGNAVELTDEAILSGYGDPAGEAARQVSLSVASALDNQILTILGNIAAGMTHEGAASGLLTTDDIADALTLFGEDLDGEKVILMSPAQYAVIRKAKDWVPASEIAAQMLIRGTVGMVHGCQVVISNKLATSGNAYIVKPGALRYFLKRGTLVETDRNILNETNLIKASKIGVGYLYDASKAIKLVKKA